MRELDILLERYLQESFDASKPAEKAAFRQLLTLSDPELASYLLRGETFDDSVIASVIERVLGRAQA